MISNRATLPNLLTALGAVAGFFAIVSAHLERLEWACALLLAALFLDRIDGAVARSIDQSSRFGHELDALADTVSFCVAPAFLSVTQADFSLYILAPACIYVAAGIWRLAEHLVHETPRKSATAEVFVGLPTAVSTCVVLILFALGSWLTPNNIDLVIGISLIFLAVLMLGTFKYSKYGKITRFLYVVTPASVVGIWMLQS